MDYFFAKTVDYPVAIAVEKITNHLKQHGFGILTQIDVQKTLKDKIDFEFRPYIILGACNPNFAKEALTHERRLGLMLPCNVIVQQTEDGRTEIAAINPERTIQTIGNEKLTEISTKVKEVMQSMINSL